MVWIQIGSKLFAKVISRRQRYINSQTDQSASLLQRDITVMALIIKLIIETFIVSDLYEAPVLCHKPYLGPVIKLVVDSCVHSLGFL